MLVAAGKAEGDHLGAQLGLLLLPIFLTLLHHHKVRIGGKGAQQVENVVATVIAYNALALHRGADLHLGVLLATEHLVRHNLQRLAGLVQQLQVALIGHHRLAKVNRPVHHRLLLVALQNARDDALGGHSVALVVHHRRRQRIEALNVNGGVGAHAVQVVAGGGKGGRVPSQLLVVISNVKTEAEEDVVPDEHLHLRVLARVQCHDVPVDDGHRPPRSSGHKVRVHLKDGPLANNALR